MAGNIYTYENRQFANRIKGERVICADVLGCVLDRTPGCAVGTLLGVVEDYYPFEVKKERGGIERFQFIREVGPV